jgi:hypothetical protein
VFAIVFSACVRLSSDDPEESCPTALTLGVGPALAVSAGAGTGAATGFLV